MSAPPLGPAQARGVVTAGLDRPPQDMLEAAVVLESWLGVPAQRAVAIGREMMADAAPDRRASAGRLPAVKERTRRVALEALALIAAVAAIAGWAAPLGRALGPSRIELALLIALPLTLGLQWLLRIRYLGREDGVAHIAARPLAPAAIGIAAVGVPPCVLGVTGAIVAMLTLIWVGGTVLISRGWALLYAVLVAAATVAIHLARPQAVVAAAGVLMVLLLVGAVASDRTEIETAPGRWRRACAAAALGAALGVLLVADPTIGWGVHGAVPALALLPSMLASLWAGTHLWRLHVDFPRAMSGVRAAPRERRSRRSPALAILGGALARLAVAATLLSGATMALAPRYGLPIGRPSVFAAFAAVALVTLVVSLLEALGRVRWGAVAAAAAVAAEVVWPALDAGAAPGMAMAVGAGLGGLVGLAPLVLCLLRPGRALATMMWIR